MIKDDKQVIQTILKKEQVKKLKEIAEKKGLSMSAYIRIVVLREMEKDKN